MYVGLLIASVITITAGWLMYWKHPIILPAEKQATAMKLSVVIPARNEQKNLPALLKSLNKQTVKPYEVIVADDGSTDETALVAKEFGVRLITVQKEADWKGKTAACFQGAQAASGDWFVFMDADTWLADDDSLENIVSTYQQQGAKGMLSIQPYHVIQKKYENFSVVFNILTMAGMNIFSILGKKLEEAGGFGPFMMCAKENYFQTGGHEAAKESLIEGFTLAKNFRKNDLPLHLYGGKETVHFRMYPDGLDGLIDGWTKHFATGSKGTHPLVMTWIACWITGGFLIPGFLVLTAANQAGVWMGIGLLCYIAYFWQFYFISRRTGNFSIGTALVYPIAFAFFVAVFARSWLATNVFRSVQWKGQKIDL